MDDVDMASHDCLHTVSAASRTEHMHKTLSIYRVKHLSSDAVVSTRSPFNQTDFRIFSTTPVYIGVCTRTNSQLKKTIQETLES